MSYLLHTRDRSLFRGGERLVEIGGGVNNFYAGKKGGHINVYMHITEFCYRKGVRGRVSKECASQRGG